MKCPTIVCCLFACLSAALVPTTSGQDSPVKEAPEPKIEKIIAVGHFYTLLRFPDLCTTFVTEMRTRHRDASALVLMGDSVLKGTEAHWKRSHAILGHVPMPVHFVAGNHDLSADLASKSGVDIWKKLNGPVVRSVELARSRLLFLNSASPKVARNDFRRMARGPGLDQPSLDLLESAKRKPGRVNLAFMHHHIDFEGIVAGVYSLDEAATEKVVPKGRRFHTQFWLRSVRPLLRDRVDAVFSGDWSRIGAQTYGEIDGIPYYRCGFGTSPARQTDPGTSGLPYLVVAVTDGGVAVSVDHLPVDMKSRWFFPRLPRQTTPPK